MGARRATDALKATRYRDTQRVVIANTRGQGTERIKKGIFCENKKSSKVVTLLLTDNALSVGETVVVVAEHSVQLSEGLTSQKHSSLT